MVSSSESRAEPGYARRERKRTYMDRSGEGGGSRGNHGFPRVFMAKAIDKEMVIERVRLVEKTKEAV